MTTDPILGVAPLGFPWQTKDPFLFCVHHVDLYPQGNDRLGPAASLAGRDIGQDFAGKDGWRMYHGDTVPGFPQHPHRGFETVTFVREGFIDHSDSLGATARFGRGDVQWLTAGAGIVHSEMFPLLDARARRIGSSCFRSGSTCPRSAKFAAPYFTMFWSRTCRATVTAARRDDRRHGASPGALGASPRRPHRRPTRGPRIPTPISRSGSSRSTGRVDGRCRPPPDARTRRTLYFFRGTAARRSAARRVAPACGDRSRARTRTRARGNGDGKVEVLLMQGRPIGEPVAQYGPFVMNTRAELEQAFNDYRAHAVRRLAVPRRDPVHPRERGRFARHADGQIEHRPLPR